MSVIGGVGERRRVFGKHQWNIARFLYYWHSSHWLASGKSFQFPKEETKQKANQTNTKRLIDTVCEATLWTYRGQE